MLHSQLHRGKARGYRQAEVCEVRGLDGAELGEAAQSDGALESLVGRGKTGAKWGTVVRRMARARGGVNDVMGRRVGIGAGSRSSKHLVGGRGMQLGTGA